MVRRKNAKNQPGTTLLKALDNSDLPLRIERISEQTGLSSVNLLQKWILQEESVIGLMQHVSAGGPKQVQKQSSKQTRARPGAAGQRNLEVRKKKKPAVRGHKNPEYRDTLLAIVKQLREEGMTLQKIAETFNGENKPTLSGTGKWFASSIKHLLNTK